MRKELLPTDVVEGIPPRCSSDFQPIGAKFQLYPTPSMKPQKAGWGEVGDVNVPCTCTHAMLRKALGWGEVGDHWGRVGWMLTFIARH